MVQNRLMFGLITGSVGFGLSLLILRDFQRAAFTGLMGFVGSQAALIMMVGQQDSRFYQRQQELRQNIRSLQRKRTEAYESLMQLRQEHDRLAAQLAQQPTQSALTSQATAASNPWQPQVAQAATLGQPAWNVKPVSWNLAEPKPAAIEMELNGLETRVKSLSQEEESLQQSLHQTLSAKKKADLHLTTSKAELNQLQAKIVDQERQKQALSQTMQQMDQQRQQMQQDLVALQTQVHTLEKSRQELNLLLQTNPPQRQQSGKQSIDPASQSLQTAIAQMQSQITSLRGELDDLEGQILQRRSEKQQLDQTIAQLQMAQSQQEQPAQSSLSSIQPFAPKSPATTSKSQGFKPKGNSKNSQTASSQATNLPANSQPGPSTLPKTPEPDGLSAEWLGLKQSLQAHEFQALRAIALEANPGPVLKRLAEDHLTMPEMLIDTINERALETIGDLILETGSDAANTIIAQEYREQLATLIAKHSV